MSSRWFQFPTPTDCSCLSARSKILRAPVLRSRSSPRPMQTVSNQLYVKEGGLTANQPRSLEGGSAWFPIFGRGLPRTSLNPILMAASTSRTKRLTPRNIYSRPHPLHCTCAVRNLSAWINNMMATRSTLRSSKPVLVSHGKLLSGRLCQGCRCLVRLPPMKPLSHVNLDFGVSSRYLSNIGRGSRILSLHPYLRLVHPMARNLHVVGTAEPVVLQRVLHGRAVRPHAHDQRCFLLPQGKGRNGRGEDVSNILWTSFVPESTVEALPRWRRLRRSSGRSAVAS